MAMNSPRLAVIDCRIKETPMEISIRDLAKDFGLFNALHGVDLDIRDGELLALLGPSGSGKTTLLRAIAGLEAPSRGQILFGEEDASLTPVRERRVGFVFQHYALFRHMTVAENIAFGLTVKPRALRPTRADIAARVADLLKLVQLTGLDRRYPAQLSGGQRQRVALARALAVDPKVLLLDEPFGALDAKVRKELRAWLRQLHREVGTTTVFVTHDQDEALELADRVVVLNNGHIEQIGTPDEIYDTPASPFVYEFIGDSSLIPVVVGQGRVWLYDRQVPLGLDVVGHGPAKLYVRQDHWDVTAPTAGLVGIVRSIVRSGAGRRIEVEIGHELAVRVDLSAGRVVSIGDRLGLTPKQWRLFLADGQAVSPMPAARSIAAGIRH
jgi:sulfate transport system ATP-binding protein